MTVCTARWIICLLYTSNEDRHGANFGFYMDNRSGKLLGLYPLMDHDHAFSEDEDIPSQSSEQDETLQQAAYEAINHAEVSFDNVLGLSLIHI